MRAVELVALALIGMMAAPDRAHAADAAAGPPQSAEQKLSAAQLAALGDSARSRGNYGLAEKVYRALAANPDVRIRSEGRFRLAMMLSALGRRTEAALLLRQLLDEQPTAQRARLEYAQILDRLGDETGARRALREVQAGGLPPDVMRFVDRYSAALRAQKPFGGSIDVAIAPDSNINRATRSDRISTVIGDFILDDQARQRSGIGAAFQGQTYARLRVSDAVNVLARVTGSADLYRKSAFGNMSLVAGAGPELRLGADRLSIEGNRSWRWFGRRLWQRGLSLGLNYLHPLGRRAQMRGAASAGLIDNRFNRLQGGRTLAASLSIERALSPTSGVGASIAVDREALRDKGYATRSGQLGVFAYHDFGALTLVGSLSALALWADQRLIIYPERRRDRLVQASLGATYRKIQWRGFSPFVRITREANHSSVDLFNYHRTRADVGLTRPF